VTSWHFISDAIPYYSLIVLTCYSKEGFVIRNVWCVDQKRLMNIGIRKMSLFRGLWEVAVLTEQLSVSHQKLLSMDKWSHEGHRYGCIKWIQLAEDDM